MVPMENRCRVRVARPCGRRFGFARTIVERVEFDLSTLVVPCRPALRALSCRLVGRALRATSAGGAKRSYTRGPRHLRRFARPNDSIAVHASFDGATLELADSPANSAHFGRPGYFAIRWLKHHVTLKSGTDPDRLSCARSRGAGIGRSAI